ncbi:hypothetical protein STIAU_4624 [Stigmatella aurantiaca DW4/3-1]|nr:hypothetical protein STIAU_4624 [Stigmatella aurantiaca DW4/3-1]
MRVLAGGQGSRLAAAPLSRFCSGALSSHEAPPPLADRGTPGENTMNPKNIIRAWKDPAFRASLSPEERAALPESPSGQPLSELSEEELLGITGGQVSKGEIGPSTGCTGPVRPTCGIVICPITRDMAI